MATQQLPYSFPRRVDDTGRISLLESMLGEVFKDEREWAYLLNVTVGALGVPVSKLKDSDKRYGCIYVLPKSAMIQARQRSTKDIRGITGSYRHFLRQIEGVKITGQNRIDISTQTRSTSISCPGDAVLYLPKEKNWIEIWDQDTYHQAYPDTSSK